MVSNPAQRFGEDIRKIIGGGDMINDNVPIFNAFSYVVVTDVNVLDTSIVFCVSCKSDRARVISIQVRWFRLRETNLGHRGKHPKDLLCGSSKCHILGFRRRKGTTVG